MAGLRVSHRRWVLRHKHPPCSRHTGAACAPYLSYRAPYNASDGLSYGACRTQITAAESLVLPSDVWSGLLPLAIVPLERQAPADPYRLQQLLSQYGSEQYVLSISRPEYGSTAAAGRRGGGGVAGAEGGGLWGSREGLEGEEGPAGEARWGARGQGRRAAAAAAEEEKGDGRRLPVQLPLPKLAGVGKDRDQPKVLVSLR